MTMVISPNGQLTQASLAMSSRDMKYMIGLCCYGRDAHSLSAEEIAGQIAENAMQDENYWTTEGLALGAVTQHFVRAKLDDMRKGRSSDNYSIYVSGARPVDFGTARLLEQIYDEKPVLDQSVHRGNLYDGEDEEEVSNKIARGQDLFQAIERTINIRRGFRMEGGEKKPPVEKKKSFLDNIASLFGFGRGKRGGNTFKP